MTSVKRVTMTTCTVVTMANALPSSFSVIKSQIAATNRMRKIAVNMLLSNTTPFTLIFIGTGFIYMQTIHVAPLISNNE